MTVSFVRDATAHSGSVTTATVNLTTPPVAGQFMVFAMGGDKNTGSVTMPTGWTPVYSLLHTSVSLHVHYKVSDGTETTVPVSWVTAPPGGNELWVGIYGDDSGANTWEIVGQASRISTGANATTWTTGTPASGMTAAGTGLMFMAQDTLQAGFGWSAGITPRWTSTRASAAGLFVGEVPVAAGASPVGTGTWSVADQASGALLAFRTVGGYSTTSTATDVDAHFFTAGVAEHPGGAALPVTANRAGAGSANLTGPSTALGVTASPPSAGRTQYTGPSTRRSSTVTLTAAGTAGGAGGNSTPLTVTAGRSAAGRAELSDTVVSGTVTGNRVAAGRTNITGPSTVVAVTANRVAANGLGGVGQAPRAVTVTTSGQLRFGKTGTTQRTVTATLTAVGLTQYGRGAQRPITVLATATGTVRNVPTSYMTDILYAGLPAVYREADQAPVLVNRQRLLYRYLDAVLSGLHSTEVIAQRIAGGGLTDPVTADDAWIPWLAQVIGVAGDSIPEMRQRILALSVAPALGSATYLIALTKSLLTDTQSIEYIPQPPWTILVRVKSTELGLVGGTTQGLQDAIMATGRVPTGFVLTITTTGQTWQEIDAVSAMWSDRPPTDTWAETDSAGL